MRFRPETEADRAAVRAVNEATFETPAEADLVEALRRSGVSLVSLVAEVNLEIIGHILFSPVWLNDHANLNLMGLGPMAVMPDQQRKGVGSELVRRGYCQDRPFTCAQCHNPQVCKAWQQKWWYEVAKGYADATAKLCRPCRRREQARRAAVRRVHLEGIQRKKVRDA
jgi:GNAT superfamily N-acetyltransferase